MALHRLRTDLGVALVGGALIGAIASALALPACGIMSSDDCADKATCVESDGATRGDPTADVVPDQSTVDALMDRNSAPPDSSSEVKTDVISPSDGADRTSVDAGHDGQTGEAPDADGGKDSAVNDGAAGNADAEGSVNPIPDAFADVPADAIYMGDAAACEDACTNPCIPSFVPCCLSDGGCGCIEFFFPVVCQ